MSVLIKGMKMPKNCTYCDSIGLNVAIGCPVMTGINGRATDCPLVEIPPHGRLIDADAFAEFIKDAIKRLNYESLNVDGILTVADVLNSVVAELEGTSIEGFKNAPTVIEAEEDHED